MSAVALEREHAMDPGSGPLFVTGLWRSGTSLLYTLLNKHPQIALLYEDGLPHLHAMFWLGRNRSAWLDKWEVWNGAVSRHRVDTDALPSEVSDITAAVRAAYRRYAIQHDATVWGSESPTYHHELVRLAQLFPDARFVVIWRDVRAICRSALDAAPGNLFFSRRGIVTRAILGYQSMKLQCDAVARMGLPIHQIDYEDLVRDPVTTMKGICDFLAIPFDAEMARLEGADRSAFGAILASQHHTLVRGDTIIASRGTFAGMSAAVQRKTERYIRLWHRRYGSRWPLHPRSLDAPGPLPSTLERMRDRTAYESLRSWERVSATTFALVPASLWKLYRAVSHPRRLRRSHRRQSPASDHMAVENTTHG